MRPPVIPATVSLSITFLSLFVSTTGAAADAQLPAFDPLDFDGAATADNRYFPLAPGQRQLVASFAGSQETEFERSVINTLDSGPRIFGVNTITFVDQDFENDRLVEETRDFFAQDINGNVWYFGESVTNFIYDSSGNLVDTNKESSWLAGVNGSLPGQIMPADPVVGDAYFQEFSKANEAMDEGKVHAVGVTLQVGDRTYDDVLVVLETTTLDADAREFKYYAPGVGLVRIEEDLDTDLGNPELVFDLVR